MSDDGKGSISIYGETFEDENLDTQHAIAGFVSMANKGKLNIVLFVFTAFRVKFIYNIFFKYYFSKYNYLYLYTREQ